jgi:hypothetical protein
MGLSKRLQRKMRYSRKRNSVPDCTHPRQALQHTHSNSGMCAAPQRSVVAPPLLYGSCDVLNVVKQPNLLLCRNTLFARGWRDRFCLKNPSRKWMLSVGVRIASKKERFASPPGIMHLWNLPSRHLLSTACLTNEAYVCEDIGYIYVHSP